MATQSQSSSSASSSSSEESESSMVLDPQTRKNDIHLAAEAAIEEEIALETPGAREASSMSTHDPRSSTTVPTSSGTDNFLPTDGVDQPTQNTTTTTSQPIEPSPAHLPPSLTKKSTTAASSNVAQAQDGEQALPSKELSSLRLNDGNSMKGVQESAVTKDCLKPQYPQPQKCPPNCNTALKPTIVVVPRESKLGAASGPRESKLGAASGTAAQSCASNNETADFSTRTANEGTNSVADTNLAFGPTAARTAGTVDFAPNASATAGSQDSKPRKKKKRSSEGAIAPGQTTGRWTEAEHQAFLRGLHTYGREWKKVAAHIPTRSSSQVRSHAQKYFCKLQREEEMWMSSQQQQQQQQPQQQESVPSMAQAAAMIDSGNGNRACAAGDQLRDSSMLSESVQANVARILAEPESVQAEVEDTLTQLRARYRQLQARLEQSQTTVARKRTRNGVADDVAGLVPAAHDDISSGASIASLQNEELIALHVLQGALPHGHAAAAAAAADASLGSSSRESSLSGGDEHNRSGNSFSDQQEQQAAGGEGAAGSSTSTASENSDDTAESACKRPRPSD